MSKRLSGWCLVDDELNKTNFHNIFWMIYIPFYERKCQKHTNIEREDVGRTYIYI